jgi:hypothetical protein
MSPLELVSSVAPATASARSVAPPPSPGSSTTGSSPCIGLVVGDERRAPAEYRWARQVSAVLLIAVVVLVVVLDVIVEGYEVSPPVLVPLLLTAAGLLSVDLPRVRP